MAIFATLAQVRSLLDEVRLWMKEVGVGRDAMRWPAMTMVGTQLELALSVAPSRSRGAIDAWQRQQHRQIL